MATVRIYKVAELLNTSSQEVLALLKRAHGIELKSASSTIEEVVARQFVERLARERSITLPGGDMFAEGPAAKPGIKKPAASAKKPEPAKPAAPTLAPPRLVKTAKPAAASPPVEEPVSEEVPLAPPIEEPEDVPVPVAEVPVPPAPVAGRSEPATVVEESPARQSLSHRRLRGPSPQRPPLPSGLRPHRVAWCPRASD